MHIHTVQRGFTRPLNLCCVVLVAIILTSGCRKDTVESAPAPSSQAPAVESTLKPSKQGSEPASSPPKRVHEDPSAVAGGTKAVVIKTARNVLPLSLYIADRLDWLDKRVVFRATAVPGEYYNCHYKGRKASVYHVRLRGDGAAYLDGYVPRDKAGEKLWIALKKKKTLPLTVTVVMRTETVSTICSTQVDVIDHRIGWDDHGPKLAASGALERRIQNARDRVPVNNRPTLASFKKVREEYVDSTLSFRVRARLDRYYQCRYRDAERTHYAISMTGDGYAGLRAYIPRNEQGRALARLLASDEGRRLTVSVTIPQGRFDELCSDQVEIVSWQKGWKPGRLQK